MRPLPALGAAGVESFELVVFSDYKVREAVRHAGARIEGQMRTPPACPISAGCPERAMARSALVPACKLLRQAEVVCHFRAT